MNYIFDISLSLTETIEIQFFKVFEFYKCGIHNEIGSSKTEFNFLFLSNEIISIHLRINDRERENSDENRDFV